MRKFLCALAPLREDDWNSCDVEGNELTTYGRKTFGLFMLSVLVFWQSIGLGQNRSTETIDGFAPALSDAERKFEEQFRAVPSPTNAREELRRLTAEAHIAGSPEDYATAIYVRDQMRSFGLDSQLKEYQVLLPSPRTPSIVE